MKLLALMTVLLTAACAHMPFSADAPLRILVLNVHGGKDPGGQPNLDGVASLVTNTGADLVLLQDVDPSTVGTLGTKLRYASAGGDYGIAALARGFIGFSTTYRLTVTPAQASAAGAPAASGAAPTAGGTAANAGGAPPRQRGALAIIASLRTGEFGAINTQIDATEGRVADQNVSQLADAIAARKAAGTPLAVGGSFNATPDHPGVARLTALGLRDAWTECGSGDGFTFPADAPAKRVDYLFLGGDVHCSAASVLTTQISDHRPLLVTLK